MHQKCNRADLNPITGLGHLLALHCDAIDECPIGAIQIDDGQFFVAQLENAMLATNLGRGNPQFALGIAANQRFTRIEAEDHGRFRRSLQYEPNGHWESPNRLVASTNRLAVSLWQAMLY